MACLEVSSVTGILGVNGTLSGAGIQPRFALNLKISLYHFCFLEAEFKLRPVTIIIQKLSNSQAFHLFNIAVSTMLNFP